MTNIIKSYQDGLFDQQVVVLVWPQYSMHFCLDHAYEQKTFLVETLDTRSITYLKVKIREM